MILKPEELTGEILIWVWDNLDRRCWRMVIDKTHSALAGYEFDNEEDVLLIKLKFRI